MGFIKKLGAAVFERVVVNYKSTLLGLASAVGVVAIDQLTTYLQGLPPGTGSALAALLVTLGALAKSKLQQSANVLPLAPPKGFALVRIMLVCAALAALLGYKVARAEDVTPAPLFPTLYLDAGHLWSVTPLAGVSGTLYDLAHSSAARSFQFSLGAELKRAGFPVGLALSGAFQAGDVIGGSAVGAFTLPSLFDTGVGFSYMFAGTAKSYGPVVVKVVRF